MILSFTLLLLLGGLSKASQAPFLAQESQKGVDLDVDIEPNVNATGHLVFETVSSLLQQWPNTRYRNGHNIVPGSIPPGTLLYHGRSDERIPSTPEWTATDPEHSLLFCRGFPSNNNTQGCWHLTLVATRTLKVLYFDGSGAAKMNSGSMDSQDIVAWGEVMPDRFFDERERIQDLCNWGKGLGIDGFVRMEMDFEVMLCDFTAGVEVDSFLNLDRAKNEGKHPHFPGGPPEGPGGPPGAPGGPPPHSPALAPGQRIPSTSRPGIEVIRSGAHHNAFPGDTRIKLDLTRLVSFYDPNLVPSLVTTRNVSNRLSHRLQGISKSDVARVIQRLENAATSPAGDSGIDWSTLFRVIKDRFADRLELVRDILNTTSSSSSITKDAYDVHSQLDTMLLPYVLYALNTTSRVNSSDISWVNPAYEACAVSHTRYIRKLQALTESELLLLDAAEQTSKEICRVVSRMWARGVSVGLYNDTDSSDLGLDLGEVEQLIGEWNIEINRLMSWLDWSVWLKCRPACGFGEICYLPTWPFSMARDFQHAAPPAPPGVMMRRPRPPRESPADQEDPQPSCRRVI